MGGREKKNRANMRRGVETEETDGVGVSEKIYIHIVTHYKLSALSS